MGGKKRVKANLSSSHSHPKEQEEKRKDTPDKKEEFRSDLKYHLAEENSLPKKKHIIKRVLKIHHDFPPGIAMLLAFSVLMCLFYIVLASMFSFTMVLGTVIQGAASRFINIIVIIVISFMIFGISKKKVWAYHLALWVFSLSILNSFISMFFIKKSVSGTLTLFVILSFFFMLMMNLITLWYVRKKKTYFLHIYHPSAMTNDDRKYIYGLIVLWLMFIFMTFVLVNSYYTETTKKVDLLINELNGIPPGTIEDYCSQKVEDRDLCFLTGAIMYEKSVNQNILCGDISSQFYKYTCYKAIMGGVV